MGKDIDFVAIQEYLEEHGCYSAEETSVRLDAILKKALNKTGPRVTVVDWREGAEVGFRVDVDVDDIVERG